MQKLIASAIATKAAPTVHAVIADECIRLGVGRREYRNVIMPTYNRIRDAIGWKDTRGATFCPKWRVMKAKVHIEMKKGPNKAIHIMEPNWHKRGLGCVWTQADIYLAERLIAYRSKLPQTYRDHLKTLARRLSVLEQVLPGMCLCENMYMVQVKVTYVLT